MKNQIVNTKHSIVYLILVILFGSLLSFAQETFDDEKLFNQYIQSKQANNNLIVFDSNNIKLFWPDKTVSCKDSFINILLKKNKDSYISNPLKIQLSNVNESLDCKIEVFASDNDFSFYIIDGNKRKVATASPNDSFLQYHVSSALVHLEELQGFSFSIVGTSNLLDGVHIKKIVLSFFKNPKSSYLPSPGTLTINCENISPTGGVLSSDQSFEVTGTRTKIISNNNILVSNNTIQHSVKIKNTGSVPTRVFVGYAVYSDDHKLLNDKNYPLNNKSKVLNVISAEAGKNEMTVDSNPEWVKNAFLAYDAKEDLSDIPSRKLLPGRILEVKDLPDGLFKITMDKPLNDSLDKNSKIRIHGQGDVFIYTNRKVLQPNDEEVFSASIKKDSNYLEFSPTAFSKGVYSAVPIIFSYSVDNKSENTILISDYTVSY